MTSLSLAVVLQLSLLANAENSYAEAHAQVLKTGEPMVVMVTADWCPACQTMKTNVLPQVQEHGLLRKVIFTIVNVDRDEELGKRLVAGGPIPQLLMFRRTEDGWRMRRLIGGQNTATVEEFINQGIEANRKPGEAAPTAAAPQAKTTAQPWTTARPTSTQQAR